MLKTTRKEGRRSGQAAHKNQKRTADLRVPTLANA